LLLLCKCVFFRKSQTVMLAQIVKNPPPKNNHFRSFIMREILDFLFRRQIPHSQFVGRVAYSIAVFRIPFPYSVHRIRYSLFLRRISSPVSLAAAISRKDDIAALRGANFTSRSCTILNSSLSLSCIRGHTCNLYRLNSFL